MNIFKRLFNIGKAEANSAIDSLENPIKMTEQGIRDMKKDLDKSLEGLAQIKALSIRSKTDKTNYSSKHEDYHNKALALLKKAQEGNLNQEEADRLAKEALLKKEECKQHVVRLDGEIVKFDDSISKLERNISGIKSNVSKWENELRTLKARVKVSTATKNINKQMAQIDGSSTVSMLERMKEKVDQEEALAEAYGDIAEISKSLDDEIEIAIDSNEINAANDLEKLKQNLGITSKEA